MCNPILLLLSLTSSSTLQADSTNEHRNKVMENFILPSRKENLNFFTSAAHPVADVCRWNGVICSKDEVRAIYMQKATTDLCVDMHWLPPTLQYVHLIRVTFLDQLHPARMPRNLKYFYTQDVKRFSDFQRRRYVDLKHLPLKLEEFVLRHVKFDGTVSLLSLPPCLKLLWICGDQFRSALLDPASWPKSLQSFLLWSPSGKVVLRDTCGKSVNSIKFKSSMEMAAELHRSGNYQLMNFYVKNGKMATNELIE